MTPTNRWAWIGNIFNNATVSVIVGIVLGWFGTEIYRKLSQDRLEINCIKIGSYPVRELSWGKQRLPSNILLYIVTIKNKSLVETSSPLELEVRYDSESLTKPQHLVISQDIFLIDDLTPRVTIDREGNRVRFFLGEMDSGRQYSLTYLAKSLKESVTFEAHIKEAEMNDSASGEFTWISHRRLNGCPEF